MYFPVVCLKYSFFLCTFVRIPTTMYNEKYNQCEICKASYVIYRQFPKETFELDKGRSSLIPSFCMYIGYLLISSLIIGLTDTITNFHSIVMLNNGHEDMKFMDELNSGDSFTWILYYTNYTSYLICMVFSLSLFCSRHFCKQDSWTNAVEHRQGCINSSSSSPIKHILHSLPSFIVI